jgi:serine/threonine-protein kinase HipA
LRITAADSPSAARPAARGDGLRLVTADQLSERIRERAQRPFSVWDGKVRLSIAGDQDKIAVYFRDGEAYLADDGHALASTIIVKPQPVNPRMASLPANEHTCMRLAAAVGLPAADTHLAHVPQPVLLVRRFDRVEDAQGVRRLHVIDGCQALGVSAAMKYERAYGDGQDVRHLRDGVCLPRLFGLLALSPQPARDRQVLLDWAIFQVLIANTGAHGKNISFFCDVQGLRVAPAYDLVCGPALGNPDLSGAYALAIGDAFGEDELSAREWARFAVQCGLPIPLVARRLELLARRTLDALDAVVRQVRQEGVPPEVADSIADTVRRMAEGQLGLAPKVRMLKPSDFQAPRNASVLRAATS